MHWSTLLLDFGDGSPTLFQESSNKLENWGHGSTQIIIVSLPKKYLVIHPNAGDIEKIGPQAFYDYVPTEKAIKLDIQPGLYVKPEFVLGIYDSKTKEFLENEAYYDNLSIDEQKKLFDEIKRNYIQEVKTTGMTLEEYSEIIQQIGLENPLTEEEINEGDKLPQIETALEKARRITDEVAKTVGEILKNEKDGKNLKLTNEFLESLNQTLLNQKVVLPNGNMIPASHYIEEIVKPLIPESGTFKLKNGVEISARQYIEEFIMFELEKYNGDLEALMSDTLATDEPPSERDSDDKNGQGLGIKQEQGSKVGSDGSASKVSRETTSFEESLVTDSKQTGSKKMNSASFRESLATKRREHRTGQQDVNKSRNIIKLRRERDRLSRGENLTEEQIKRLNEINAIIAGQQQFEHQGQKKGNGITR